MPISGVSSTAPAGASRAASGALDVFGNGMTEKNMFLQILSAQLRYQDPLKPMDDTQFITQLAQLHQLEQLQHLNETLRLSVEDERRDVLVGHAIALVGKEVAGLTADGKRVVGVISSVRVESDGLVVRVGDTEVVLIEELRAGARTDAPAGEAPEAKGAPAEDGQTGEAGAPPAAGAGEPEETPEAGPGMGDGTAGEEEVLPEV